MISFALVHMISGTYPAILVQGALRSLTTVLVFDLGHLSCLRAWESSTMFGGSPTQQAQPASASAGANLLGPAPAKAAAPSPVHVPDVQAPPLPPRDEDPWRGWGPVNREGGRDRDRDRRGHRGFQDHRHHSFDRDPFRSSGRFVAKHLL